MRMSHKKRRIGRRLLNDSPIINLQNFTMNENVPIGTYVGAVNASDPDTGQTLTFSITAGNSLGHFAIAPNNGSLTVAGPINYEAVNAYDLTVQVVDNPPATPLFEPAVNFGVGGSPQSVAIADLNNDRNLDLAVANSGSAAVLVLLGNGAGSFGAATNFAVGNSPYSVAIGDVTGDHRVAELISSFRQEVTGRFDTVEERMAEQQRQNSARFEALESAQRGSDTAPLLT